MSVLRDELHRVVDLLPEGEVGDVLAYAREHAAESEPAADSWPLPDFVGMVSVDDPTWSIGSAEFLREHLGRAAEGR